MHFTEITKSIHDAWRFASPPILAAGISVTLIYWIYPISLEGTENFFVKLSLSSQDLERVRSVLEPYGLSTLIPVLSFVCILFLLYVVNRLVIACQKLPPHISYSPDILIHPTTTKETRLLLFRKYPTAGGFNTAYSLAVEDFDAKVPATSPKPVDAYYHAHIFIKFTALFGTFIAICNLSSEGFAISVVLKALLLLGGCLMLWFVIFVGLLYEQQQEFYRQWSSIVLSLQEEAAELLKKQPSNPEKERVEWKYADARWWHLRLFDAEKIQWFKENFLRSNKPR